MKTGNDGTECVEKQSARSILPLTQRWFASTPPIRTAIQLAHNQSENPVAQMSDIPPPQTSHVELEQTTFAWLRKPPTQLNTPNIFVPDLVRVSPNASDVQRLGRCVPAFKVTVFYLKLQPIKKHHDNTIGETSTELPPHPASFKSVVWCGVPSELGQQLSHCWQENHSMYVRA